MEGGRLLDWHREKAGTVEHTHDEVKNELGGGHVPSQRFGVNSAWFKIALLTYNIVSAIKGLCLEGEERTARMKRFRLLLIHVAGRMNRNNCVMGLRLCNNAAALKRMQRVWQVFELPTQATSAKALGAAGWIGRRANAFREPHYRMRNGGSVSGSGGYDGFWAVRAWILKLASKQGRPTSTSPPAFLVAIPLAELLGSGLRLAACTFSGRIVARLKQPNHSHAHTD